MITSWVRLLVGAVDRLVLGAVHTRMALMDVVERGLDPADPADVAVLEQGAAVRRGLGEALGRWQDGRDRVLSKTGAR